MLSIPAPPLGARAVRPVVLRCDPAAARALAQAIPGVVARGDGVACAWDAAPVAAALLGLPAPAVPMDATPLLPGLGEYQRLGLAAKLRPYQREMVLFLARRAMALNADPMRSGKTPTTIAAAVAVGAPQVVIVCPAIARLVWATEIAKWATGEALLLCGRGADEARWFCRPCMGKGRAADGSRCPACKAKNGSSYGTRVVTGAADVEAAVRSARWIIVNYDLLVPQSAHDAAGKRLKAEHLPGWADLLASLSGHVVIADEAHLLRGRGDLKRRGDSRRERLVQASRGAARFWALTGTPLVGRVADLWGLLDAMTDGLYGRPFFAFDVRYADGHKGQYGWVADGNTNTDELKQRLDVLMLKRTRAQLNQFMPPKVRQVVTLDLPAEGLPKRAPGDSAKGVAAALRRTAKVKAPAVVENVIAEMAEGGKVLVFAYLKRNADDLAAAIGDACGKPPLKARKTAVWSVSGDTPTDVRFRNAEAFREHDGPAAFVATLDSVQVALSLKGAQSVHFADLHYEPAALLQAEDRPYEPGTRGVTVLYYVVSGSIDQHVVDLVLPKMGTLENVGRDAQAGEFSGAFAVDEGDLAEAIWARHTDAGDVQGSVE